MWHLGTDTLSTHAKELEDTHGLPSPTWLWNTINNLTSFGIGLQRREVFLHRTGSAHSSNHSFIVNVMDCQPSNPSSTISVNCSDTPESVKSRLPGEHER